MLSHLEHSTLVRDRIAMECAVARFCRGLSRAGDAAKLLSITIGDTARAIAALSMSGRAGARAGTKLKEKLNDLCQR